MDETFWWRSSNSLVSDLSGFPSLGRLHDSEVSSILSLVARSVCITFSDAISQGPFLPDPISLISSLRESS